MVQCIYHTLDKGKDMKIKITSDSTCDLGEKLIKENDIGIFALQVILGEQSYSDGVNIVPQDIFDSFTSTSRPRRHPAIRPR